MTAIGQAARLDDAATDLPFSNLVPLTEMCGVNDEQRRAVWVNRRHVTHIAEWQEWSSATRDRKGAPHSYVFLLGPTCLHIAEPLSYVATALQS